MKYLLIIIFACLFGNFIYGQPRIRINSFRIKGTLEQPFAGIIYLHYSNKEGHSNTDSIIISGKHFNFTGQVNQYYAYAHLTIKQQKMRPGAKQAILQGFDFGLENTTIVLSIYGKGLDKIKIRGNNTESEVKAFYKHTLDPLSKKLEQARKQKKDSTVFEKLRKSYVHEIELYCTAHPSSNAATYIFYREASYIDLTEQEMNNLFALLSPAQQESYFGKFMQRVLHRKALMHTQIGRTMPNFTATSFSGDSVTLYALTQNGYVLLDFWASWCNPCRKASPHLRALYTAYHEMGFEILGVSCDTKEAEPEWRKAIADDSVFHWKHILTSPPNLPPYLNRLDLLKDYEVGAFPTLILLDKNNKIILRASSEEDVALKLKEIYDK